MNREVKIRKEIFKKVREFYKVYHAPGKFLPGKSNIKYAGRVFDDKELVNLVDASLDFWLTSGRYTKIFEKKLAEFLSIKHCILTNSGSSANLLAVSALTSPKLGNRRLVPGDEIITTACGFPTTVNPIIQNGLIPVFVDVEMANYNIKPDEINRAISKKTKAIFVAHTLGNPADMGAILRIAKKHNLWLIEDNCDSLGARYRSRFTGTFGHISTASFYPAHHITTGEGGAVMTNDPLLRKIILSLRDWGRDCWCDTGSDNSCKKRFSQKLGKLPYGYDHKYIYSHIGYNLKMTDMQAAIGAAQLRKLPRFIRTRSRNFKFLYRLFKSYDKYFVIPEKSNKSEPSWFGFPLLVRQGAPFTRKEIVEYLEDKRIATRMLFGGNLTKQPAYENINYRTASALENTDRVMNNLFWLGVYPGIGGNELTYIAKSIKSFMADRIGGRV